MNALTKEEVKRKLSDNILVTDHHCWEWQRGLDKDGYGSFKRLGERSAHRVSYIVHIGPIPKKICMLHKCDNRSCVNPDRLFLGTRKDNNLDRHAKGRSIGQNSLKTYCVKGHEFSEENTRITPSGCRACIKCSRINRVAYYNKNIEDSRRKQRDYRRRRKL